MTIPLSEQVVLITGASTGIGAACTQLLAQQFSGIRLVIAARNADKLEELAANCRQFGAEVLVIPTDISQIEQVEALASKALDKFGRIDALVNNAGYGQMGPLELLPPEAAQRQFQVNLLGPLALIRILIPVMRSQGGGRIINISSLGGRVAFPTGGLYSASKFALEGLSDALRREVSPFNIKVSVIEPGPVSTDFFIVAGQRAEQSIPDAKNTIYRAAIEKVSNIEKQTAALAWSSERVGQVIIKALKARNPRPRYVAATGGDLMLFMMTKVLPTWAVDWFWQKFYGIDRVAKDWQKQQQQSS